MKMWLKLKLEEFWIFLASIVPRPLAYYCYVRIISEVQKKKISKLAEEKITKLPSIKKTFYNLKEDEYDRRAQEMVDRKVKELNKSWKNI